MAFIRTTGTVVGIQIVNIQGYAGEYPRDFAKITLKDSANALEFFIIWPNFQSTVGEISSARAGSTQRLVWTTTLALCRDAMTHNLPVTVDHDDNGAYIGGMLVGAGVLQTPQ